MAKQKIVVKVTMCNEKKTRKALMTSVSLSGVESVSLIESNKDQILVTGKGIDPVKLVTLLRKDVGYTELLSVSLMEEKNTEPQPTIVPIQMNPYPYCDYHGYGWPYCYCFR